MQSQSIDVNIEKLIYSQARLTEVNKAVTTLAALSSASDTLHIEVADAAAAVQGLETASSTAALEHALATAMQAKEAAEAQTTLTALTAAATQVSYELRIQELSAILASLKQPKATGQNTNAAIKVGMFHLSILSPTKSVSDESEPLSAPAA